MLDIIKKYDTLFIENKETNDEPEIKKQRTRTNKKDNADNIDKTLKNQIIEDFEDKMVKSISKNQYYEWCKQFYEFNKTLPTEDSRMEIERYILRFYCSDDLPYNIIIAEWFEIEKPIKNEDNETIEQEKIYFNIGKWFEDIIKKSKENEIRCSLEIIFERELDFNTINDVETRIKYIVDYYNDFNKLPEAGETIKSYKHWKKIKDYCTKDLIDDDYVRKRIEDTLNIKLINDNWVSLDKVIADLNSMLKNYIYFDGDKKYVLDFINETKNKKDVVEEIEYKIDMNINEIIKFLTLYNNGKFRYKFTLQGTIHKPNSVLNVVKLERSINKWGDSMILVFCDNNSVYELRTSNPFYKYKLIKFIKPYTITTFDYRFKLIITVGDYKTINNVTQSFCDISVDKKQPYKLKY